jgi:hypothetical protein
MALWVCFRQRSVRRASKRAATSRSICVRWVSVTAATEPRAGWREAMVKTHFTRVLLSAALVDPTRHLARSSA